MAQELFYTSVPRGLLPGSQGFCTVAATRGMQPGLIEKLESLTGYKPLFAPNDSNAELNPVGYFHYRMTVSGRTAHVLGRIGPAQVDYSGRTNKFAHLVILDSSELPDCGPAALLLDPSFLHSSWEGSPEWIEEPKRIPSFDQPASYCRQWQRMTGDAGWAGVLVSSFETTPHQAIYLMYEPGEDQLVLTLFAEALALLPPEERWNVGFSTYPSNLSPGISCHWRGAINGHADSKSLQRTGSLVWPLTPQLGRAEDGPLTRAAREGKAAPRDRKRAAAAAPAPKGANFPAPTPPAPAGNGSRYPAEAPNRLSAIIPPQSADGEDEDADDVRVIEEEAAPRPRSRPAPRREPEYPREPRERSKGGIGTFWGIVLGAMFTLVGILVLEMALQNGLAQKVGIAHSPVSEKTGGETEPKQVVESKSAPDDREWEKKYYQVKTEMKNDTDKLQRKIDELTQAEKKRQDQEIQQEIQRNKEREQDRQKIAELTRELEQMKKGQTQIVEVPRAEDKKPEPKVPVVNVQPNQPLVENRGIRGRAAIGGGDLVPSKLGPAKILFHNLGFTGKSIEVLFGNDLFRSKDGRIELDEEAGQVKFTFHPLMGEPAEILILKLQKNQLHFEYLPVNLGNSSQVANELLNRCIIKVNDANSGFFQCIYLRDPEPISKDLGKFAFMGQIPRNPLSTRWQPRLEMHSEVNIPVSHSSSGDLIKRLRVTTCELEIEGYPSKVIQGPKAPLPLIDSGAPNRPDLSKSFSEDTVLWHAEAKEKNNFKEMVLSLQIWVYGKEVGIQPTDLMPPKAAVPNLELGQVKLRNFTISLDMHGALVPLFQYKDDSKIEKKVDPKKEDPKKEGSGNATEQGDGGQPRPKPASPATIPPKPVATQATPSKVEATKSPAKD